MVVGCGHMGALHARTLARHPRAVLSACVDRHPERAERLAAAHGTIAAVRIPTAEVVIVATPTASHMALASPLLEAGAHVLVEKPLALAAGDARVHPRLWVGHSERFNPAVRAACPVGLERLEAWRLAPPGPRARDVDVLTDLLCHDLDLLLAWADDVVLRDVRVDARVDGRVEAVEVRLCHDRGDAVLRASRVADERRREMRIADAEGSLQLDLLAGRATRNGVPVRSDGRDALTAQVDAILDTLGGAPFRGATSAHGLRVVQLVDAIRAQVEGR